MVLRDCSNGDIRALVPQAATPRWVRLPGGGRSALGQEQIPKIAIKLHGVPGLSRWTLVFEGVLNPYRPGRKGPSIPTAVAPVPSCA